MANIVGNRRFADKLLARLLPGDSVVMIDVDCFKDINDGHGHNAGDKVLVSLAGHLRSQLRVDDHVARLGGEEFLIVLARGGSNTVAVVERMAQSWQPPIAGTTFTAGIAEHVSGATGQESLARADAAMYDGKRSGRRQVVAAKPASSDQATG